MTPEDLPRFAAATGLCLPPDIAVLDSKPPWLEGDTDQLIALNEHVRIPGTPWIGDEGLPWPEDHVVIGEDGCGNYWSILRPDTHPPAEGEYATVWFLDHETGKMELQHPSIGAFLLHLEITFPIEKVEIGEWRVIAGEQKVGPLKFGMTRDEVRNILDQPVTEFRKSNGPELTDAFDTLDLHVYYRDGGMQAVELWNAANVILAGVRLGDTTFAEMERMLTDPVQPLVVTPTSVQSVAYGVEFGIETADQRETVGAITEIIIVAAGYYERAAEMLAAITGKG